MAGGPTSGFRTRRLGPPPKDTHGCPAQGNVGHVAGKLLPPFPRLWMCLAPGYRVQGTGGEQGSGRHPAAQGWLPSAAQRLTSRLPSPSPRPGPPGGGADFGPHDPFPLHNVSWAVLLFPLHGLCSRSQPVKTLLHRCLSDVRRGARGSSHSPCPARCCLLGGGGNDTGTVLTGVTHHRDRAGVRVTRTQRGAQGLGRAVRMGSNAGQELTEVSSGPQRGCVPSKTRWEGAPPPRWAQRRPAGPHAAPLPPGLLRVHSPGLGAQPGRQLPPLWGQVLGGPPSGQCQARQHCTTPTSGTDGVQRGSVTGTHCGQPISTGRESSLGGRTWGHSLSRAGFLSCNWCHGRDLCTETFEPRGNVSSTLTTRGAGNPTRPWTGLGRVRVPGAAPTPGDKGPKAPHGPLGQGR